MPIEATSRHLPVRPCGRPAGREGRAEIEAKRRPVRASGSANGCSPPDFGELSRTAAAPSSIRICGSEDSNVDWHERKGTIVLESLKAAAGKLGKPAWRPMLRRLAELHEANIHPPRGPLPHPWENLGPGYCYGPAFGHWDIAHIVLDVVEDEPAHARNQLANYLATQDVSGVFPHITWMHEKVHWDVDVSHPQVWPAAAQEYLDATGDPEMLRAAYDGLSRMLAWLESHRAVEGGGFYYEDILRPRWESGVDEGVRFLKQSPAPIACVDATSHAFLMYDHAARWAAALNCDATRQTAKAEDLRRFIQARLFDEQTGFFHDAPAVGGPASRAMAFEGVWPVVVGAAAEQQAARVIDENLLNPKRFFTPHPISTVAAEDPRFELRMWRGPAWNSMTHWAARGCVRYGRPDAAAMLLEKALDATAEQFERTGKIWEFHHPHLGTQEEVRRKPGRPQNTPCTDYLGHNPLIAMARLWEALRGE